MKTCGIQQFSTKRGKAGPPARAKAAGIAEVSDVALLKRLRKAEEWLRRLCASLLQESNRADRRRRS